MRDFRDQNRRMDTVDDQVDGARLQRRWLAIVLAAAFLIRLPGLATGLFADDFVQHWTLEHGSYGPELRPWALFEFGTALGFEQAETELSGAPWWTSPDWKARFLRPLSSVAIWLEHELAPCPWGHQAIALALLLALLASVGALARAMGSSPAATTLAIALLAVEESTHLPVAWTANRNSLLEALFGVLALLAVVRSGAHPIRAALLGTAFAAAAAASKESGAIFLLLVAFALPARIGGAGRAAHHLHRLIPLAVLCIHALVFIAGSYGARSLYYPEPWTEPGVVMVRGATTALFAPLSLLSPASIDLWIFHPADPATWLTTLSGAIACIAVALLIGKRSGAHSVNGSRFGPNTGVLALWFLLGLALQAPAPPSDRLLLVPAIPFVILVGRCLCAPSEFAVHRALVKPARALILITVLVGSGTGLTLRQISLATVAAEARHAHAELAGTSEPTPHRLLLQLPNALTGLGLGPAVRLAGGAPDAKVWPLRFGRGALEVVGLDTRTLELRATDGPFLANPVERVFSSFDRKPHGPTAGEPGTVHEVGPVVVEVLDGPATADRADRIPPFETVRLTLADGIDPHQVTLLAWSEDTWVEVPWPGAGERSTVAAARSRAILAP